MSFNPDQLGVLASVNGWTHWIYDTKDPLDAIMVDGYFDARAAFKSGHKITVICPRKTPDGYPIGKMVADVHCAAVAFDTPLIRFNETTVEEPWMEPA